MGNAADLLQLGVKDDPGIAEGLNTGCVLPLISRNRVLGVLALGRYEDHGFTQVDFAFLIQVANQIAIAIENSSAYHESTSARAYLEECLKEIQNLKDRLQDENLVLREQIDQALMFEEIVGTSSALQAVLSLVSKVAPMDSTVLLTGETGTGKELIARAIHKRSRRSSRPFVGVNCAGIPASLIGSELFGHEKGAFTGALQRRLGRFEVAEEGTLFLDEVGELPAETQLTLLRVLQEREFERVGGNQPIRANVRVIAATNRDLRRPSPRVHFVAIYFTVSTSFRLRFLLCGKRREDIPLLVEYFIDHFARKARKASVESIIRLWRFFYRIPGQVIFANCKTLSNVPSSYAKQRISRWMRDGFRSVLLRASRPDLKLTHKLAAHEKEMIEVALRKSEGRVSGLSGAAAKLGISRSTLESKIRSLKINKYHFKTARASKT